MPACGNKPSSDKRDAGAGKQGSAGITKEAGRTGKAGRRIPEAGRRKGKSDAAGGGAIVSAHEEKFVGKESRRQGYG